MPSYRTHITVLRQVASQCPDAPVFQVPQYDPRTNQIVDWHPVSYSRFFADVELFARYWTQRLSASGVELGAVVGVW